MHGKKPTVAQRKFLQKSGLNSSDWFVQKDTPDVMQIVHRHSDKVKLLSKNDKGGR